MEAGCSAACQRLFGLFLWQLWRAELLRGQNRTCALYSDLFAACALGRQHRDGVVQVTSSHFWLHMAENPPDELILYAQRLTCSWNLWSTSTKTSATFIVVLQKLGKVWTNWRKCFTSAFPLIRIAASTKRFHLHSKFSNTPSDT